MYSVQLLERICDILIARKLMHEGQKRDVQVRHSVQEKRILLEKRQEIRKLVGKRKVDYDVSEIEIIASFKFPIPGTRNKILTEQIITRAVAEETGYPFVLIDPLSLDFRLVTSTLPGPFAEKHLVVPLKLYRNTLTLALAHPFDTELIEQLPKITNRKVEIVISPKSDVLRIILEYHGFRKSVSIAAAEFHEAVDLGNLEQYVKMKAVTEIDPGDRPIVQAVWYLFNYAFDQRASDIHIEPKRDISQVRLRIDGVLHRVHMLPKVVHPAIVSRIKTLARMDIAEKRRPQDGRIKTSYRDTEVELRVNTIPTAFGEKVVVRIFDPSVLLQDIGSLGFFPEERKLFESFLARSTGMLLITGPTGSGKTTTLYTSLQHIASPTINIATIEDPIEMVHEEFNQVAVHPKIGLTFAAALRTLLRQDPDVIMVGEIRDEETTTQAIQAALTGHLVLSTLHTNDAASAITRLLNLNAAPFLLASVLIGVVAQRLVRTICPTCVTSTYLSPEEVFALNIPGAEGRRLRVRYGEGCPRCRGTGYLGRTGVFEVMPVNRKIQELISARAPAAEIKREAVSEGMLTLREYAIKKLAKGITTYEEVMRLTDE